MDLSQAVLVVATQNSGKLAEMQNYLEPFSWQLTLMPPDLEIIETGQTFAENALLKASSVARITNKWAIADDSGLEVAALDGAPGIYSARYGARDCDRIHRLLTALQDQADRTARFVCVIALARPDGSIACQAEGICAGEILLNPEGEGGFGYDPIFYVPHVQQTFAQLSPTAKQKISHRGIAFANLQPQLEHLEAELRARA
ncbi:MAG: RdgB/HAM1 family non-canonical purine NTP pyrophosphatase [Acaryochloridaceae cyanobacterium SU_2_1]|nr:RdgB/HAM1 family non-canonical purine NTP pyrophosphatase [Acaryochloridaceae cyanobacterium SU_2_1]